MKNLIRMIIDDHRDAAIYREAVKIFALALNGDNVAVPEFEDPLLNYVAKEITLLKSEIKNLKING
jgi:hypothetical protein